MSNDKRFNKNYKRLSGLVKAFADRLSGKKPKKTEKTKKRTKSASKKKKRKTKGRTLRDERNRLRRQHKKRTGKAFYESERTEGTKKAFKNRMNEGRSRILFN